MQFFQVKPIKTHLNQIQLNLRSQNPVFYDLACQDRKLDRVAQNSFFEHIEVYYRNKQCDLVKGAYYCKKPTITVYHKLIDGVFKISWITISESLVHEVSWSVESLNIFMLNHGLPVQIVKLIRAGQQIEIEALSKPSEKQYQQSIHEISIESLGVTKATVKLSFSSLESQMILEIQTFTPDFYYFMQHPRLSKQKRKEIKSIFKV